ncbi:hypothetical protein NDK40_03220 [Chlamydia psittaci]|nr:hypothetical protein NDK40_03220 [Chlamydia psittaci]
MRFIFRTFLCMFILIAPWCLADNGLYDTSCSSRCNSPKPTELPVVSQQPEVKKLTRNLHFEKESQLMMFFLGDTCPKEVFPIPILI